MTPWFVFALMTAAAIFAVLWPLGHRARSGERRADGDAEVAVYKHQLTEIDGDLATGRIGADEAKAARVEISRRLLAAADRQGVAVNSNLRARRWTAVTALVGLPALALAVYLPLGSPGLRDFPVAERRPDTTAPLDDLVARVQQHLVEVPTDGRGWTLLAPVLERLGRYDEAVQAYRNVITYVGESAARRADLGEALVMAANGVVTAEARAEFQRAVTLDGDDAKANYFLGVSAEQDGRGAEALTIWRDMLAKAPADAPWRPVVEAALARAGARAAPTLPDGTVAAAQDLSESDRSLMIRGMVDRLSARLQQDGGDVDGWLRLMRAYIVMGERDKAKNARDDARKAVANDATRLQRLNEGLKDLGLDG